MATESLANKARLIKKVLDEAVDGERWHVSNCLDLQIVASRGNVVISYFVSDSMYQAYHTRSKIRVEGEHALAAFNKLKQTIQATIIGLNTDLEEMK